MREKVIFNVVEVSKENTPQDISKYINSIINTLMKKEWISLLCLEVNL